MKTWSFTSRCRCKDKAFSRLSVLDGWPMWEMAVSVAGVAVAWLAEVDSTSPDAPEDCAPTCMARMVELVATSPHDGSVAVVVAGEAACLDEVQTQVAVDRMAVHINEPVPSR